MDGQSYHLIIDEVSDKYGDAYLDISIRYLQADSTYCPQFYKIIKMDSDCSGEALLKIIGPWYFQACTIKSTSSLLRITARKKYSLDLMNP